MTICLSVLISNKAFSLTAASLPLVKLIADGHVKYIQTSGTNLIVVLETKTQNTKYPKEFVLYFPMELYQGNDALETKLVANMFTTSMLGRFASLNTECSNDLTSITKQGLPNTSPVVSLKFSSKAAVNRGGMGCYVSYSSMYIPATPSPQLSGDSNQAPTTLNSLPKGY